MPKFVFIESVIAIYTRVHLQSYPFKHNTFSKYIQYTHTRTSLALTTEIIHTHSITTHTRW